MIERAGRWLAERSGTRSVEELEHRVEIIEAHMNGVVERLKRLERARTHDPERNEEPGSK